ncbi:MAG: oxidoreductase [bacterium]|jgi:short-subunit dehydrogenase|nr:oxidoreductase [bacterium]
MKKVILVTGASSGIGYQTVKQLVAEGHIVYAAARRIQKMEPLKTLGAHIIKLDLTSDESIRECIKHIDQTHQRLDVLVNNAGYGLYGAVEDVPIEKARAQFEVNIFGLARITQLALPIMRKQTSGTIINMSSMGGKIYTPLGAWYYATKHALEGWSDTLRLETKEFGIQVVLIEPGIIKTEFSDVISSPLLEMSGKGAYTKLAQATADTTKKAYSSKAGSPASVIANTVSRIVQTKRPKTRYAVGRLAKPILVARKLLPDRWFDWLVMRNYK